MRPRGLKTAAILASAASGLLFGRLLSSEMAPAWSRSDLPAGGSPRLVLPDKRRDLGTVSQGVVLHPTFPVRNAGTRRLVLVEKTEGCCGRSASPRVIVVAPGGSKDLTVEVDTAQWYGRLEQAVRYSSNDPTLPCFALEVTADVGPPVPVQNLVPCKATN